MKILDWLKGGDKDEKPKLEEQKPPDGEGRPEQDRLPEDADDGDDTDDPTAYPLW